MVPPSETGTIERFLQTLLRSGLMKQEAIAAVFQSAGEDERKDAHKLAELFVRQGKLSHFQSRKLLEGTATGLVLGPYHIVMPIGRGGMGTVYLARDTQSPRLLALKVLPPAKARANDRVRARFLREMEMSRRVSHPNLTQTIDVGVENGVYFIAMEYIAGVSLYRLVSTGGVLPVGRAAKLFAQAAEGLAHAHSQGLIHRDLKPSNIMVTPRDQVKVLDLGLALVEGDDLTNVDPEVIGGQGYVVGTMDYIAPEQTQNATAVTPRSDLYSLGCSLYFAMTGQPPFPGGDGKEKIRKHRESHPKPVQEINPLVPADFSDVIHQLLAKLPEERPASAAEFRKLLLRFADPIPQPYETSAKPPESRWADEMEILQAEPVEEVPSQSEWEWMPSVSLAETARDHPVAPPTIPAKWLLWAVPGTLGLLMLLLLILGLRKR